MSDSVQMDLSASLEDYLEAIFRIVQEKSAARAKDIGKRLKVSRSSVTGALHALAQRELINYAPYDLITLTDKGRAVAEDVARRHEVLRDFFVKVLAVGREDADEAACKMEHAIPDAILDRFLDFVEFVERCPRGGSKWIKGFGYYCDNDNKTGNCEKCVELVLDEVRSRTTGKAADGRTSASLGEMKLGEKGVIVRISGTGGIRRRLLDMGATAGTLVEVERVAPFGDPIEVKIKGYHLTLRKDEAERIAVKLI
ncbi:MAG: metal-dependent transcriptional regulator [Planctomycetes bacterium]|jgi:DtxR family Mn-dependent transcriptional regulator|nr:metal-dependent transcriptional regulator [Planctomycetota bacterium]